MSSDAWKRENTVRYNIRMTICSGIPEALQKMTERTGETATEYMRRVVRESLIANGYLTENSMPEK